VRWKRSWTDTPCEDGSTGQVKSPYGEDPHIYSAQSKGLSRCTTQLTEIFPQFFSWLWWLYKHDATGRKIPRLQRNRGNIPTILPGCGGCVSVSKQRCDATQKHSHGCNEIAETFPRFCLVGWWFVSNANHTEIFTRLQRNRGNIKYLVL